MAEGLTNVQVLDLFLLRPCTENARLKRIYTQVGIPIRGAAIPFACEHGLTELNCDDGSYLSP